jgi:hypothetical protein
MPPTGVTGFQSNFYLTDQLKNLTSETFYCPTHPKDEFDMYCTQCKVAACHKCIRTKHTEESRNHPVENLPDAARKLTAQLLED